MMPIGLLQLLTCLALALLSTASADCAQPARMLTALVAASTQDAIHEVARAFTAKTGIPVKISPGASSALANQIINGAKADIFLSANQQWADKVRGEGLAASHRLLLTNELVLVVPRDNPAEVKLPSDLLRKTVKHVALAGENVPAGIYAEQALKSEKIYERLLEQKRIVRGQDVRASLTFVERGEAEAGVVYSTDARASDKVLVVHTFDPASHDKIVYPLVLLKHGAASPEGKQFFDFLSSQTAGRIFERHGFQLLKN